MSSWEEVKRLAADFQKIQLTTTTQKLSERNCVEIISWLIDRKMIELIFTSDGKEYMTPSQLVKDIQDELYISGGRVNLIDLAKSIGVDLAHINASLNVILKGQKSIHLVLGQLLDTAYINKIVGEINEKLSQQGQINVSDLTIHYDLPTEFLQHQVLEKHLGKSIIGKQDKNDPKLFFTETFVTRTVAKIRGALCGLTKPTSVTAILNSLDITEKLFFSLFDQASSYGSLTNRSLGAQYIPNIYSKSQNEWVTNFYKQNGYLEFDALIRLGISDYKTYLKKQFSNEKTIFLNSCIISQTIVERIEIDVEECISSKTYIDLQSSLPSVFNIQDVNSLLDIVLSNQMKQQTLVIDSFILSNAFIENLSKGCEHLVNDKAKVVVQTGKYQQFQTDLAVTSSGKSHKTEETEEKVDKREERRKKAAGGKSGGGTQGRETKTKSTKKFPRGGNKNVEETEILNVEKKRYLEIVDGEDIEKIVQPLLEDDGLDELLQPIVDHLLPKLNEMGLQIAETLYATTVADQTASRRQTHNELQNKLNTQIGDVRLFEKGIKLLPNDVQPHLYKYLLKTLCTDIVTDILNYLAQENNLHTIADSMNNDQRLKFVNELPKECNLPISALVRSLAAQNIEDFTNALDDGLSVCSMIIKKIDKKKDRVIILNHKHELLDQLNKCDDLALILHLAAVVIFTTATQCMLHASGRHVASILVFLKQYLTEEQSSELTTYHDYITLMLNGGSEEENVREKLKELVPVIKKIANEFKRPGFEKS